MKNLFAVKRDSDGKYLVVSEVRSDLITGRTLYTWVDDLNQASVYPCVIMSRHKVTGSTLVPIKISIQEKMPREDETWQ